MTDLDLMEAQRKLIESQQNEIKILNEIVVLLKRIIEIHETKWNLEK